LYLAGADVPGHISSGYATFNNGLIVRYDLVLEPPLKNSDAFLPTTGVSTEGNRMHRSLVDRTNHSIFGYDLVAAPADAANRYVVTIEPLHVKQEWTGNAGPLKPVLLPKYPDPQIVQEGDTIALDLLVSPNGRQKLVDYIRISGKVAPKPAATAGAAKDFTLDDGPITFDLLGEKTILINGRESSDTVALTGKSGSTFWFYFPGRGRYVLSLAPHEGFQKAGTIRDNVILFEGGGDQYEMRMPSPIAGAGAWNLYVLHDPLYQPKDPARRTIEGGVDRLENLLPER
jgi:hypothetical protein